MRDPEAILVQQTENVQSARQIRLTSADQSLQLQPVIRAYIEEAMAIEESGQNVERKKTSDFNWPKELIDRLDQDSELKTAFEALTPGRQRGYLLHFTSAKQATTRTTRIEKYMPKILSGKGLDD